MYDLSVSVLVGLYLKVLLFAHTSSFIWICIKTPDSPKVSQDDSARTLNRDDAVTGALKLLTIALQRPDQNSNQLHDVLCTHRGLAINYSYTQRVSLIEVLDGRHNLSTN